MIISGTHEDLNDPSCVPMILGAPLPMQVTEQETITTALVGAATAFSQAFSPPPTVTLCTPTAPVRMTSPVGVKLILE